MSTLNPYLKQYQKSHVETASQEKILILLYDGAIQFLNKAKLAIQEGRPEDVHNNILGCENIIMEFMGTLDMEIGGELAVNLYRLYEYLYNTLVMANIKKDIKKINEVLKHLTGLRTTWLKAIAISNAEKNQQEQAKQQKEDDEDGDSYYEDDDDDEEDEEGGDKYEA